MNVIDDSIISKLVPFIDSDPNVSIRLLEWNIEENILKAGDNYTSQICRLWIHYEKEDIRLSRSYFIKIPMNSPVYQTFKTLGSYDEEIIVYTKILPEMYRIEKDYFTPRLYYSDDKMTMILEDLSQFGYKCVDRRHQLDFEQCSQALRGLAKLHGLSVVAYKTPKTSNWMRYQPEKSGDPNAHMSVMDRVPMYIDSLSDYIKSKYPDQILTLKNLSWDRIVKDYSVTENVFSVFCHGDFWTNNIMFKYNDASFVDEKVKVIDFQFSHWGSPALDIIHFTVTSMRFEVYERHFHQLLEIYLDTLNEILGKFDVPVYTMQRLLRDIDERYSYACFVFSCILPITLAGPESPANVEGTGGGHDEEGDQWIKALRRSYKQKLFIDVSTKWLLHFVDKGYLNTEAEKSDC